MISSKLKAGKTVELTDSDYPPVYGAALESKSSANDRSVAIIDHLKICEILFDEGYEVEVKQVKSLNIFPSPMNAFQYALYSFGTADMFLVVMVNKRQNSIYGYHVLDLTQTYSLVDDLVNKLKAKSYL